MDTMGRWMSTLLRRVATSIVSTSPVPNHVAFIMDGNRRYAETHHLRTIQGHSFGYQRLIQALEWCLDLGISCVSVYAFSVDNFKRSEEEVATLMQLAEEKLEYMLQEHDVLKRHGVQVRVVGDLSLAPPGVQHAAHNVMEATKHHSNAILNICFAYTYVEEYTNIYLYTYIHTHILFSNNCRSSEELQQAMDTFLLENNDSSSTTHSYLDHMYTRGCPPVDIVIRTSGERRLSDFLLLQSRHAFLVFSSVLWPDFGFLDLLTAIMQYQQKRHVVVAAQAHAAAAVAVAVTVSSSERGKKRRDTVDVFPLPRLRLQHQQCTITTAASSNRKNSRPSLDSPRTVALPTGDAASSPSARSEEEEDTPSMYDDTNEHRSSCSGGGSDHEEDGNGDDEKRPWSTVVVRQRHRRIPT